MESLPELFGTDPQVQWASKIRTVALTKIKPSDVARIAKVVDSTWWIGNRWTLEKTGAFKEPAPYQLDGGPLPPTGTPLAAILAKKAMDKVAPQPELAMDETMSQLCADDPDQLEEQPDAVHFATSVSRTPELAEITILALMARAYRSKLRGELFRRATAKLEEFKGTHNMKVNRDIDGINKLLGRKQ